MVQSVKLDSLVSYLKDLGNVAVSYSGGVDSTFLLFVALQALGLEHVRAVTVVSDITPPWDLGFASSFVKKHGITHHVVEAKDKIQSPEFKENTPERCYHCKVYNHGQIRQIHLEQFRGGDLRNELRTGVALGIITIETPLIFD